MTDDCDPMPCSMTDRYDDPVSYMPPEPRLHVLDRVPFARVSCGCMSLILIGTLVTIALLLLVFGVVGGLIPFGHADALSAAGLFGRGANAELIARLRAVTNVLKDNLLGFIGGAMILFVLGLALAHMAGEQRAQERTARLIYGILFLAAASGFVA